MFSVLYPCPSVEKDGIIYVVCLIILCTVPQHFQVQIINLFVNPSHSVSVINYILIKNVLGLRKGDFICLAVQGI